jgi:CRISPR-associated protein Cmr5
MKEIQKLFPYATDAVRKYLVDKKTPGEVDKEYKGYVASFGASVITAGLLPTLAFYTDISRDKGDGKDKEDKKNEPRRYRLLQTLWYVYMKGKEESEKENTLLHHVLGKVYPGLEVEKTSEDYSYDFVSNKPNWSEVRKVEKDLLNASVAVKLALRNFTQKQPQNTES